jgi:hypothetical protein
MRTFVQASTILAVSVGAEIASRTCAAQVLTSCSSSSLGEMFCLGLGDSLDLADGRENDGVCIEKVLMCQQQQMC